MTFYEWLKTQQRRSDRIGTFARHALQDNKFPRLSRKLHVFLDYAPAPLREPLKAAHREWRQGR